jgi:hypothetical protein
MRGTAHALKTLVRKPDGKTPIGRIRHKLEKNMKIILKKQGVMV